MDGRRKKQSMKMNRAVRLRKATMLMLCLALFFSAIYITDMSTKRMMLCKDDKNAIGVYSTGTDILRIDLAGEHYMLNYKEVKEMTGDIIKESKKLIKDVAGKVKNKSDR